MNSIKTAYWIALAVFALALNSEYHNGKFPVLHRIAGRAGSTICRITTRAENTLAIARLFISHPTTPAGDLLASAREMAENQIAENRVAENQADLREAIGEQVSEQVRESIREQVRDRAELLRDQVRAQTEIRRAQARLQRAGMRLQSRSQYRVSNTVAQSLITVDSGRCTRTRITMNSMSDPAFDASDDEN